MQASSEIQQDILRRAERRSKELMEVISEGILTPSKLGPLNKVNYPVDSNRRQSLIYTRSKNEDNKENKSPSHPASNLMYPARPARSVYNSPLIKSNRSPLWKSPREELNARRQIFHESLLESQSKSPHANSQEIDNGPINSGITPMSTNKALRIYPSLPRNSNVVRSPTVEKKFKDFTNLSTASAYKQGRLDTCVSIVDSSFEDVSSHVVGSRNGESVPARRKDKISSDGKSEDDFEDTYDMDKFLEEALGSALNLNSTMTEVVETDCSVEESLHSVDTHCTSDQLHSTSTLQSSMRLLKPSPQNAIQRDGVDDLLREAESQQQVIAQASKALTICRSSKTFFNSHSLVDAERLLLLATLRHTSVLDEIKGLFPSPSNNILDFKGQLQILEVIAPLKENPLRWGKTDQDNDLWFLCVLHHGQQIVASEPVAYETGAKVITFSGKLNLTNLLSSFVASLQIYTLRTYKPQVIQKSKLSKVCKLLHRKSKSCLDSAGSEQLLHLRTPAFALTGSASIDLSKAGSSQRQNLHLGKVPIMSPFKGCAWVQMKTSLTSSPSLEGFLTVLEKVGGSHSWQRRWCYLYDLHLHFWNYPDDQDNKVPIEVIDLRVCSSEEVVSAPRHLCARRYTLMLEAARPRTPQDMNSTLMECNSDLTVVRHFLTCDSVKDMTEWTRVLNQVLSAIKAWGVSSDAHEN